MDDIRNFCISCKYFSRGLGIYGECSKYNWTINMALAKVTRLCEDWTWHLDSPIKTDPDQENLVKNSKVSKSKGQKGRPGRSVKKH